MHAINPFKWHKDENSRPPRTTLEGMIWSADEVLGWALERKTNGIPHKFFEVSVGLVIISVVRVGFIFNGDTGSGILLEKQTKQTNGTTVSEWSAPAAVGIRGLQFPPMVEASIQDLIIFIMDPEVINTIAKHGGVKLGAQAEMTLGPLGRTHKFDDPLTHHGLGGTVCIAYGEGNFAGVSVEGAILSVHRQVTAKFYQNHGMHLKDFFMTPRAELLQKHDGKIHMLDHVYEKLEHVENEHIEHALDAHESKQQQKAEEMAQKKQQAAAAAHDSHHEFINSVPDHNIVEVNHVTEQQAAPS